MLDLEDSLEATCDVEMELVNTWGAQSPRAMLA